MENYDVKMVVILRDGEFHCNNEHANLIRNVSCTFDMFIRRGVEEMDLSIVTFDVFCLFVFCLEESQSFPLKYFPSLMDICNYLCLDDKCFQDHFPKHRLGDENIEMIKIIIETENYDTPRFTILPPRIDWDVVRAEMPSNMRIISNDGIGIPYSRKDTTKQ